MSSSQVSRKDIKNFPVEAGPTSTLLNPLINLSTETLPTGEISRSTKLTLPAFILSAVSLITGCAGGEKSLSPEQVALANLRQQVFKAGGIPEEVVLSTDCELLRRENRSDGYTSRPPVFVETGTILKQGTQLKVHEQFGASYEGLVGQGFSHCYLRVDGGWLSYRGVVEQVKPRYSAYGEGPARSGMFGYIDMYDRFDGSARIRISLTLNLPEAIIEIKRGNLYVAALDQAGEVLKNFKFSTAGISLGARRRGRSYRSHFLDSQTLKETRYIVACYSMESHGLGKTNLRKLRPPRPSFSDLKKHLYADNAEKTYFSDKPVQYLADWIVIRVSDKDRKDWGSSWRGGLTVTNTYWQRYKSNRSRSN